MSNPYAQLSDVPTFQLSSNTVTDGQPLPLAQWSAMLGVPGGGDVSPHLAWTGFPPETTSFVVTMYDPQAPTGSGFWHWAVADIPASVTELSEGAGASGGERLSEDAFQLGGDAGAKQYVGGAPPAGTGKTHNYYITVSALDIDKTGLDDTASAAYLGFAISGHTLARATIVCPTPAPAA
jgi:Raf kinase inhibitor-like YbhB/YbcL family protein